MAIENIQPLTYAVISVAFAIGTFSILLRLYCRGFMLKTFGRDDAVAVFLLVRKTGFLDMQLDSNCSSSLSMEPSRRFYTCSCTMGVESESINTHPPPLPIYPSTC